jgi:hypothetical protein
MKRSLVLGSVCVLLLLVACATSPQIEPEAATCQGDLALIVRNNTEAEVEIWESRSGSRGRNIIAIVQPGHSKISIRNDPGYFYSARLVGSRNPATAETRPRVRARDVTLQRVCS